MSENDTNLTKLYKSLKPLLFSNQVIYYNLLFILARDCNNMFFIELELNIGQYFRNKNQKDFTDSLITKKFYQKLLNTTEDISYIFPSIKSNVVNTGTARSDISQAINRPGPSAIPKYWRNSYLRENNRSVYKALLDTILKYYVILYHSDIIDMTLSTSKNSMTLKGEYWEALTQKLSSQGLTFNQVNSFEQLENIIIGQIYEQCNHESRTSLHDQWDFYVSHIDCYGERSIDKFHALERYSKENAYCSYKLADIYYYGGKFVSNSQSDILDIEVDYLKAAEYYKHCTLEPNLIVGACWSLGYMYLNNKLSDNHNNIDKAIELFSKCGNYAPALNSLGLIDKNYADQIYNNNDYRLLNDHEKSVCKKYYISFIEKCYSACCNDWLYAFNNLYAFYIDDNYKQVRKELLKEQRYIDLDPMTLLNQSVERKNPWAMDTLAMHYICDYIWNHGTLPENCNSWYQLLVLIKKGIITLKDSPINKKSQMPPLLLEAKKILKELNNLNYSRGSFHMAINFYYDSPIMGILLEKAAKQGHKQATNMLSELKKQF